MSKFSHFMRVNKITRENEKYAPTKSLTYDDGNPLKWEFRRITSKENEMLRESCTIDVPVTGKPNMYRPRLDSPKYLVKLICASVVYPDLYDAELQDSYGVKTPEDLVYAMVDNPGEYSDLTIWIQKFNGFDETFEDKVNEAKN